MALLLVAATLSGCGAGSDTAPAPTPAAADSGGEPTSVADGVYTAEQAERGRLIFRQVCGECHSRRDFRGEDFFLSWEGTSVGRLLDTMIDSMPEDDPGSLPIQQYLDAVAYILSLNEYPQGARELEDDAQLLRAIRIVRMGRAGR